MTHCRRPRNLALVIASLVLASLSPVGAINFRGPYNTTVGDRPDGVAVADFDGDSYPDLAVSNTTSDSISILLGTAGGGFTGPTDIAVLDLAGSVAVGDFNGDLDPDLVVVVDHVVGIQSTVAVLLGGAGASFSAPTYVGIGSIIYYSGLAVGDFNGDDDPDLATANWLPGFFGNSVSIVLGGAGGTFGPATLYSAGITAVSVSVGDFNGDDDPDLAVANADSDNVSILLGTAGGTFIGPTNFPAGDSPGGIAIADFNADSYSDLAVANAGGGVSVLLGDGGGNFGSPTNFTTGDHDPPVGVATSDFNGDSDPDLAVTNWNSVYLQGDVSILFGGTGGSFGPPTSFGVGDQPTTLAVGDFNADSARDIVVTNLFSDNVSVLYGAPPPDVTIDDVSIDEGDSGNTTFTFTVSRLPMSAGKSQVHFDTEDDSATTMDSDYVAGGGDVLFGYGETSKTFDVTVKGDTTFEPDETFKVKLSSPVNGTITDNEGLGTIQNDDQGPCTTPPSGMVSWWPGNGIPADIRDGNHGTLQNGATFAPGKVSQAFSFDGVDDYMSIPNASNLNITGDLTIDAWVNPSQYINFMHVVSKRDDDNQTVTYELYLRAPAGLLCFSSRIGGFGGLHEQCSSFLVPLNAWTHVAVTINGPVMTFYMNGTAGPPFAYPFTRAATTDILTIGIAEGSPFFPFGLVEAWAGQIDEVELFNRALSATEVHDIFAAGGVGKCGSCATPPASMVSWWPAEGTAVDVQDGNDGTMEGTAGFAPGQVGQAFSFNGDHNGHVFVGDPPNLRITTGLTIDAWINPIDVPVATGGSATIAGKWFSFPGDAYTFQLSKDGTGLHLFSLIQTAFGANLGLSGGNIPADTFTHVAMTFDPVTGHDFLYVNGEQVAFFDYGPTTMSGGDAPFTIGDEVGTNRSFLGLIDEVEVFDRVLSADELRSIYLAGTRGKCGTCGDTTIDLGEQCDDGNVASGDCCSTTCQLDPAGSSCAADANACTDDVCDAAGVCTHPTSAAGAPCAEDGSPCTLDQCDGSTVSCQHPAGNAGTECRASAGTCDVAETCDGSSTTCPANVLQASTFECRGSAGACDLAETCNGSSPACPGDALRPSTFQCRESAGVCDVGEDCTGSSAACPADAFVASTVTCRASVDSCDVAETCTGSSAGCPTDAFKLSTTVCRGSAGVCDAEESCTGSSAACPADAFAPSSTMCRASAGVCDPAETCNGTSADCPSNAFVPSSVTCRASAGACDLAETCTGTSAGCPANAFVSPGTMCRASADACDVAEACTGTSASCPGDGFASATTVCRGSAGVCDVAESCPGTGPTCPADAKSGAVCRAAAGSCDPAESCDGLNDACPPNAIQPDGTLCNDGNTCTTGDACAGGACVGSGPPSCPTPVGTVTADVTVDSSHPSTKYGSDPLLRAVKDPMKRIYVRVHLTGITGQQVTTAKLKLKVANVSGADSDSGGRIRKTSCIWNESTLKWNTPPPAPIGSPPPSMGAVAKNQIVAFDVKNLVLGGSDGDYCFVIDTASTNEVDYNSLNASSGQPSFEIAIACSCGGTTTTTTTHTTTTHASTTTTHTTTTHASTTTTHTTSTTTTSHAPTTTTATTSTTTTTAPSGVILFDRRVAASADDAEEDEDHNVDFKSSDLELVKDDDNQTVGIRFRNVTVPRGKVIVNAYVQFTVDETGGTTPSLKIYGQTSANAAAFTESDGDISSRPKTTIFVPWSPGAWNMAGTAQQTPNLKTILQPIVNQAGWPTNGGNALVVIITGTGKRVAEAYDGDASGAPLLHIEYTP